MLLSTTNNRRSISLRRLFPQASFVSCVDVYVSSATEQSAHCTPDCLFAAIPGTRVDGANYVQEAIQRGASAILCHQPRADVSLPQCIVPHVRSAYAQLCHALVGNPAQRLTSIGVTGTNGKTTTTYLIRSMLTAAQRQTGLLGTIENHDGISGEASRLTTPDPSTFADWLGRMVERNTTHAAFELSSHAMHQGRTAGIELDVAIVTNVTHDHMDYHQTPEAYFAAKARIFEHCKPNGAVLLNRDHLLTWSLQNAIPEGLDRLTFGLHPQADVRATRIETTLAETRFQLHVGSACIEVTSPLIGRHNVENCLAAAAACHRLGVDHHDIAEGIRQLDTVPGRLEAVNTEHDYTVFVDYAHTDDALNRCLQTLKPLTPNRLICVFGAGGDRDASKRPLLAQAAQQADLIIVTSDNPRTEDPWQIIHGILKGFTSANLHVLVEPERKNAIQLALELAEPGDVILVAGKGHETYQLIGNKSYPFDDREVIRQHVNHSSIRMSA